MPALVCGKRAFFEEFPSPHASKRICCSATPIRFSPSRQASGTDVASSLLFDRLTALFPGVDKKLVAQALEECGDDLDLAIKSLNGLHFESSNSNMGADANLSGDPSAAINQTRVTIDQQQGASSENLPKDGAEWVEHFVKEMPSAANLDDARGRAARALESLEKSIVARASAETHNFQQENETLKGQLQVLSDENTILKRAVTIQHERQKDLDGKVQELEHLKQLIPQHLEQIRMLEVNNYALSMHLKQAQQSSSIPGRFHPDIF